mmetsp:Transcript_32944/g.50377  ORF Transcript_32944/g.50377 Transcript_32944/m.50377 type:complete len:121 (-) Transcript_32944:340-702(-)
MTYNNSKGTTLKTHIAAAGLLLLAGNSAVAAQSETGTHPNVTSEFSKEQFEADLGKMFTGCMESVHCNQFYQQCDLDLSVSDEPQCVLNWDVVPPFLLGFFTTLFVVILTKICRTKGKQD